MINRTMIGDDFLGLDSSMKVPVITSTVLHIILFVITAAGIPFIARDHEILTPIAVEIITPDQITQTNRVAQPAPPKEKKEELLPPKQEKPSPPKVDMERPPEITKPEPPKEVVKAPPVEQLAPPKPEKKKEPVKPQEKPKPPKKEQTKVEKSKEEAQDFASLLKNLTPDVKEEQPLESQKPAENAQPDTAIARLADRLTASEMDMLRNHFIPCWNVQAGGKYAEELIVEVRVFVNRDRTIQQATILDQARYNLDSHYRAAADAVLRALRNPRCSPLPLPPEKYNEWKSMILQFDPSQML